MIFGICFTIFLPILVDATGRDPRNPFYAANELGCHPAMRFVVVVDQSCGEKKLAKYGRKAAVMGRSAAKFHGLMGFYDGLMGSNGGLMGSNGI